MFFVCADGSVVWYFWCPGCRGELRFSYCDDVRLCCAHEMLKFFHGDHYGVCVQLMNFYLCVLFWRSFVSCVELGWRRMEPCVMGMCGESRDV